MTSARKTAPARKAIQRRTGRGVLFVIALLLASSAMLRLSDGAGLAFARASNAAGDDPAQACAAEPGAMALLSELQAREKRIADQEDLLADRAQALRLAEKKIDERLAALVSAEQDLARTVSIADQAAEDDVQRLVTLYENMKPKEAAALFEEMAPDFAAGFLAKMRPESAAGVLAGLDPKTAYSISVILAGRNAGAPKN
ncbi:MAG: hypothetical protein IE922_03100 [Sphingomonadales bacterium]|nr:hypothetical protein [Sphingomonadales bacterium]